MIISNRVTIVGDNQVITFPTGLQMTTTNYMIQWTFYDADYQTLGGQPLTGSKAIGQFVFSTPYTGTLDYTVSDIGVGVAYLAPATRLSRDWTAQAWYAELVRDLGLKIQDALYGERFNILNRAVTEAARKNSGVLGNSFMTSQSISDTSVSEVSTSALRMMMGGPEARFMVESTLTNAVDMVDFDSYKAFRSAAQHNKGRIIYTKQGDSLLFDRSTSLASYGTRTFRFPRVPELCTTNAHLVDFPDLHMNLTWIEGKRILAERYREIVGNIVIPDDTDAMKKVGDTAQLETPEAVHTAL